MVAFPDVSLYYKRPENVVFTGTPVRGDFLSLTKEEARRRLNLDGRPLIVSFWGSLGASKMNDFMADFIKLNYESFDFNHIHATGGGSEGAERLASRLLERGVLNAIEKGIDIRPYINDMGLIIDSGGYCSLPGRRVDHRRTHSYGKTGYSGAIAQCNERASGKKC